MPPQCIVSVTGNQALVLDAISRHQSSPALQTKYEDFLLCRNCWQHGIRCLAMSCLSSERGVFFLPSPPSTMDLASMNDSPRPLVPVEVLKDLSSSPQDWAVLQHIGQHVAMQCSVTQQFVQVFSTRVLPILFSEREGVPGGPGLIHCHPGELESARSVGRPYIERQTYKMLPDCGGAWLGVLNATVCTTVPVSSAQQCCIQRVLAAGPL